MPFVGLELRLGHCVLTEFDPSGFLRAQPDALGDAPQVEAYELHHTYGFWSRPPDAEVDADGKPIQSKACGLLYGSLGDQNHAWLVADPRPIALLPVPQPGESLQYGPAANFVRCKADGSVTLFTTTDGTFDGQSVYCEVAPDGVTMLTPWGKLSLKADGFHVLHASGARIDCGAIGGLPAPLDALSSYVKLAGALVQIEGSALALGSTAGLAEPAAKATTLLAVLTAVQTAVTAVNVLAAVVDPDPTTKATAAAASAAALTALATALSAAVLTLPASSTTVT
jgi:hypothetical protein